MTKQRDIYKALKLFAIVILATCFTGLVSPMALVVLSPLAMCIVASKDSRQIYKHNFP
jgi:hypothetical protein